MRAYRFRAWDGEAEHMVYSDKKEDFYVWDVENTTLKIWRFDEVPATQDEPEGMESTDIGGDIMQFTGLLDRHGKEIYEGDILVNAAFGKMVVEWDENHARFIFRTAQNEASLYLVSLPEVIGNIYSNPELVAP